MSAQHLWVGAVDFIVIYVVVVRPFVGPQCILFGPSEREKSKQQSMKCVCAQVEKEFLSR